MFFLYTDYGLQGFYIGELARVLLCRAPAAHVINLMADAPAFAPQAAGHLLHALAARLPEDSIVVAVVDPGVGSSRDGIVVRADGRWYVAPDNGLLGPLLARTTQPQAWRITWRPPDLSASFHGRDLFAPIAGALYNGDRSGLATVSPTALVGSNEAGDLPQVIYCDGFGNLMTGLRASQVDTRAVLEAGGHRLRWARTFSDVAPGEGFWYTNSVGLVEIAVNQGHAGDQLGISVGSAVAAHG